MKIVVFSYDAGIVTTLSNRYDECSCPLKGFFVPRMGDYKKNSLPAVRRRGPEPAVLWREDGFNGSGVNSLGSCPLLRTKFDCERENNVFTMIHQG